MNWLKTMGIVFTVVGSIASVGAKVVDDKKNEELIAKKVAEALIDKK